MADAARETSHLPFRWPGRVALFVALFSLYMLSQSRDDTWADARPIWNVAESIVTRAALDISTRWPAELKNGKDGKIYAVSPLLPSLTQVPGAAIRRAMTAIWPKTAGLSKPLLARIGPAAMVALTCVIFFGIALRLGASATAAALTTLLLGTGSMLWVYARYPYSEALQAFCFTGFFGQILATRERPSAGQSALLGVWAGLLINSKFVYVLALPGVAIYLVWFLRGRWRELGRIAAFGTASLLPLLALIFAYNKIRWGSWMETGFPIATAPVFEEQSFFGLWGLFLSPGKSVFLYNPPLFLCLASLAHVRRRPALLWAAVASLVPTLLLYSKLLYWAGDYAWGPRYLVFCVPVLLLPAVFLIDDALTLAKAWKRRLAMTAIGTVLVSGIFVQTMGNAYYWDLYIRITKEARERWLGVPNNTGTYAQHFGSGVCGPCFEDMHGMNWLPPFQPILGHWWLLQHAPFGDTWVQAEADAAWHRYTRLPLNIATTYGSALGRLDWWFLDYHGDARTGGYILIVLLTLGTLGSAGIFGVQLRRHNARQRATIGATAPPALAAAASQPS